MTNKLSWLAARWWIVIIAGALSVAAWNHTARISHVNYISELAGGDKIAIDANSPTGYESEFRKLVIPERNAGSSQWIMQVQEMFENGSLILRHVDYDNAPDGRSVRTSSLYRWWLGGVAWVDHMIFGNPIGVSVERAAMVADPIAQLLFLLLTAIFIARYFSGGSAALFCIGFVSIFPLGTAFLPGQPSESTLILMCSIWCVLPLVAGISNSTRESNNVATNSLRRLFFTGGFIGGIGMWIGVSGILPLLIGIVIAGGCVDFINRRKPANESNSTPLPWRLWAVAGATVTLVAWLIDRSPAFIEGASWQSDFVHPLYSLAWLGAGEILEFLGLRKEAVSKRKKITLSIAGLAICGLAYTIFFNGSVEGWSIDPVGTRLTQLPIDPGATSIGSWKNQGGGTGMLLATIIPSALLVVGIFALMRFRISSLETKKIAIALGPLLFALGLATTQLGWWHQAGGLALALAVVAYSTTQLSHTLRWTCGGFVLFASAIGASFVFSGIDKQSIQSVDRIELETLMERHLAQWLARRGENSGEVAFAPPNVSVSLAYFGSLRGLGTPYPENVEGFSVGVRLSAASTADEARALATGREISLIVHPSWDPFLEEYARLGSNEPGNSFIAMLNRWQAPRWLEPIAYRLPNVRGFEDEWVTIFQTVEVQDNTSAIGRLVEYFLDSGRGSMASKAQNALETNFPDELVTHITAAEVAMALGDRSAFNRSVDSIVQSIESGADFYLTWEFRVSMTLMLANGNRINEMKKQLERSFTEANTSLVRRLSTATLGKLLHLAKALDQEFPDPELKRYALSLLPTELQEGL